jgi:hypothetical protein
VPPSEMAIVWGSPSKMDTRKGVLDDLELPGKVVLDFGNLTWTQGR